jgi:nucleotide-binding universal stress UspA family protein
MKYILVPTDFSPNAFTATRYAGALATKMGWQLIITHAFVPFYSGFQSEQQNKTEKDIARQTAEGMMKGLVKRISVLYPSLGIQGVCRIGHVEDVIMNELRNADVVLVVMGTEGASGLKSKLIGSNTYAVIKKSTVPVLAVPKGCKKLQFQRFGFTTNYHASEIAALYDLTSLMGDKIDIIPFHLHTENRKSAEAVMHAWKSKANAMIAHRPLEFRLSRVHGIATGIANFARKEKLDILVMTKFDKGILTRLLAKDLVKAIVHHPPIPVLFMKEE